MKIEKENHLMSMFDSFLEIKLHFDFSLHEIDERPYTIKRSLVNHHRPLVSSSIIPSTSIRPDKERAFSACKYEMMFKSN